MNEYYFYIFEVIALLFGPGVTPPSEAGHWWMCRGPHPAAPPRQTGCHTQVQ